MVLPFVFPFLGIILFLALFSLIERNRLYGKRKSVIGLANGSTESMAQYLFEKNNSPISADERIEWALPAAVKKLGVDFVVLQSRSLETSNFWKFYSISGHDENNGIFQIPFSETYCSSLSETKAMLCIDYAGLGAWQNHPSRSRYGWEVYLGARGQLNDGQSCLIGFYQHRSRGTLFTKAERDFVHHLLLWVMAILNRENQSLSDKAENGKSVTFRKNEAIFEPQK